MPRLLFIRLIPLVIAVAASAVLGLSAAPTALDEFVYADDPNVGYELVGFENGFLYERYDLRLTSGSWRSSEEVDRVLWSHFVSIYVPDDIRASTALLVISGGSNAGDPGFGGLDDIIGPAAVLSGSVIIDVGQIPNQPIQFSGESEPRTEDALIAYSWRAFLDDPTDTSWPAQLPMTRGAVKAMDLAQEFLPIASPGDSIDDFIVAGASKRGWTAWLTAAVENGPLGSGRVSAVIPMVIDTLNAEASFDHHFKVYGFWAPAVGDYVDAGIMDFLGTPESQALFEIVDPYAYRDRLTMPKVVLNAAGDQFFLPDSWKFYLDGLPGDTWLRYYPNAGHSLSQINDPIEEILPLYAILLDKGSQAVPDYQWSSSGPGHLELKTSVSGANVRLWQATNPEARDFRFDQIGAAFTSSPVSDQGGGTFTAQVPAPESGWTAYFLEASFPDGTAATTGVQLTGAQDDPKLEIRQTAAGILLSFQGMRGNYYELRSGNSLDELLPEATIIPTGGTSTWLDPAPAAGRKFYQLESITP